MFDSALLLALHPLEFELNEEALEDEVLLLCSGRMMNSVRIEVVRPPTPRRTRAEKRCV